MYRLYHDKVKMELRVEPLDNLMIREITDKVTVFNSSYYVSTDRKALKDKANSLKAEWLEEAELRVETLKNLKIKNKY